MNPGSESHQENTGGTLSKSQVSPEAFDVLFARYRCMLYFIAYRVLHNNKDAEDAVQNCSVSASCTVPRFDYEGSFRSWLVRVLINEAVVLLKSRIGLITPSEVIMDALCFSPVEDGEQCSGTNGNWRL